MSTKPISKRKKAPTITNKDGTYTLQMDILAVKYRLDKAGNEAEEKFDEKMEVNVLAADGREIYSQRHPIHEGQNTLTISLKEKPEGKA